MFCPRLVVTIEFVVESRQPSVYIINFCIVTLLADKYCNVCFNSNSYPSQESDWQAQTNGIAAGVCLIFTMNLCFELQGGAQRCARLFN